MLFKPDLRRQAGICGHLDCDAHLSERLNTIAADLIARAEEIGKCVRRQTGRSKLPDETAAKSRHRRLSPCLR
jgi:hypothetical protein